MNNAQLCCCGFDMEYHHDSSRVQGLSLKAMLKGRALEKGLEMGPLT